MQKDVVISKSNAKAFLIDYQCLNNTEQENILCFFDRVRCIQYDPLDVVGRNADLVLQARIKDYNKTKLEELLYEDNTLVDGWDKMMSIYLKEDWGLMENVRIAKGKEVISALKYRNTIEALDYTDELKLFLKENGPTMANKINIGTSNPGRWGHKKLSSATLDYLFNIGEVYVVKKRGTQKVYDLTENLFSEEILSNKSWFETEEEFYEWYVERRIGSVGFIWERNGGAWLGSFISNKEIRGKAIQRLMEKGRIKRFYIEDIKYPFYIKSEFFEQLENIKLGNKVSFLAPLDNLLWDREMIRQLFNFDYTWEVYTPINKRKYGYYVLPVLYNDRFIARFEPEYYRGGKELEIKNWWWEKDIEITEQMKEDIHKELTNFCKYLGAANVSEESLEKIFSI